MGLGCISYGGNRDPAEFVSEPISLRAEPGSSAAPMGFTLPIQRDAAGRFLVTTSAPLISDEVAVRALDAFVGSFNAEVPTASTLFMELRVRLDKPYGINLPREWTPWVRIAWAGKQPSAKQAPLEERLGSIQIDELKLKRAADRMQVRMRLESNDPQAVAWVSRVDFPREYGYRADIDKYYSNYSPIDIPVPFRSQNTPDSSLNDKLCSPTSVAMVLAYYGVDATVEEVAKKCYDPEYGIYGNWPRNIQAAYEFGVPGSLVRMQSWWEVGKILETGQPLIISIRAERGELRGAPYDATEGHLIVLRGIDEFGNLIVNDPACGTAEDGKRVYRRSDLTKVWLQATDGTAYLLGTPELVQKARYQWNKVRNNPSDTSGGER